jgi:hypothetical protein
MKNSKILILLVFLFLISCKKTELKKVEDEKFIFGTSVKIVIYDDDEAKAKKLIKETFELMTKIESKYNSRNEESIVYKLNKNPDGEYFSRVLMFATKVLFCPEAKLYYRTGEYDSVSKGNSKAKIESYLKSLMLYKKNALVHENSERVKNALAHNFSLFI